MALPPLYDQTEGTDQPVLKMPLKSRLARLKEAGQKTSQQISEAAQPKAPAPMPELPQQQQQPQQPAASRAAPPAEEEPPTPPKVRRALPVTPEDKAAVAAPVTTGPATIDISGHPVLRGLAYGPNSEGATAADQRQTHGPLGELQQGDIAVSPNLLSRYPLRSYVNVVDSKGNVVLANQRVADTSWYTEGHPTTDTFEVWNGRSLGKGYYLVPAQAPEAAFAGGGIVTKPTVALVGEKGPEAIVPLSGAFPGIAGLINGQT